MYDEYLKTQGGSEAGGESEQKQEKTEEKA